MMNVENSPFQVDPAKRKLDFTETPLTKNFHELALSSHTNDDMTINTRGVMNEMSDIFGWLIIVIFLIISKEWSTKHEEKPLFDIMSTVKKSQKRSYQPSTEPPFSVFAPENPDVDVLDKENIPVSYSTQFAKNPVNQVNQVKKHKRSSVHQNVVEDVDINDEGSMTKEQSDSIRQLLSQPQDGRPSISAPNRISDVDDNSSFLAGRRDTGDIHLLLGIREWLYKPPDSNT